MSMHALWLTLFLVWGITWGNRWLTRLGKLFLDCPTCHSPVRKGQIVCQTCFCKIKAGSGC